MTLNVTPGSGAAVATGIKQNQHHQRVLVHGTRVLSSVTPALAQLSYVPGQSVGGLIQMPGVFRGAPEAGLADSALLNSLSMSLSGGTTPFGFYLLGMSAALNTPPADGQDPVLNTSPIEGVNAIQFARAYSAASWTVGAVSNTLFLEDVFNIPVFAVSGETVLRLCIVSTDTVTFAAADLLQVAVSATQD